MKIEFKKSFARDLRKLKDNRLKQRIGKVINLVEQANTLSEIGSLEKLQGGGNYYRIRIGDFRLGLQVEAEIVIFVRCLHRRDIYRYFP